MDRISGKLDLTFDVLHLLRDRLGLGVLLLGFLVSLWACGGQRDVDIVAVVGQKELRADELRKFVLNLLPGLYTTKQGQEAREDYLQSLIDQELLHLEAQNRGLEQDAQLIKKLRTKEREYIVAIFRQREIEPLVEVSEQDILRRFEELGIARERFLTAILVGSEQEAFELKEQLEVGARWADLAREHSLDKESAMKGGEIGFFNRSMAERMGMPVAVFDTLVTGKISSPLARGRVFQLVRFVGERQAELETHRAALQMQLMKIGKGEVEARKIEMLAYELNWTLAPAGCQVLAVLAANLDREGRKLSVSDRATALFTYEGGQISVDEYLQVLSLNRINSPKALEDSVFIAAAGRRFILPETMLGHAAVQMGILDEPKVIAWLAELKKELVLGRLHHLEVVDKVEVDDEAAHNYIQEHPEVFLQPERICYDELIAPNQEDAARLVAELDDSSDLLQVSRTRGFNVRPRQPDGLVCLLSLSEPVYPQLWKALQEAPLGALRGPVETRDGYVFFKVIRRQAPQPESEDNALRRARASLVRREERVRFDQFIEELRLKYQAQVTTFSNRLDAALPDALLASLIRAPQKQIENP